MIDLLNFDFGAVDSGVVKEQRFKASAAQQLGLQETLPLTGAIVSSVTGVRSIGTGEGQAKVASGAGTSKKMGANKFVAATVFTEEALEYNSAIGRAILNTQPRAHGVTFDAYVFGASEVPVAFSNFDTFADVQTATIGVNNDATVSFDDALALIANGAATGIGVTTRYLAYLKRQRLTTSGTRAFEISGDLNSGTIDGIPYFVLDSTITGNFAVVGDFANDYRWGVNTLSPEFANKVRNQGNIDDTAGVTHNLTSENKVALINEAFQGSLITDVANFVKLLPVTPGS